MVVGRAGDRLGADVSDYRTAGEAPNDLTPGESAALPALLVAQGWWNNYCERRGVWVLHRRSRHLHRPHRDHFRTIDEMMQAAMDLPRYWTRGDGRFDVKVSYKDTALLDVRDDTRERLLEIERQEREAQGRERSLRPRALRMARKEAGDVTGPEAIRGGFSLFRFALGGGDDNRQENVE